jgi:hypothetical protein
MTAPTPGFSAALPLPDRSRANAGPLDYGLWPCDRRELVDDLWAPALAHLPELLAYEARVAEGSHLVGRDLEPWRALLALALWLDDRGVKGLGALMEQLARAYQAERSQLEAPDLTRLVIQALVRCAADSSCTPGDCGDRNDRDDVKKKIPRALLMTTSQATRGARTVAQEQETDLDSDIVTARRVGRVLRKMPWTADPTKSARGWAVNLAELHRWTRAYGVEWPGKLCATQGAPHPTNVTSVISVTTVTAPGMKEVTVLPTRASRRRGGTEPPFPVCVTPAPILTSLARAA